MEDRRHTALRRRALRAAVLACMLTAASCSEGEPYRKETFVMGTKASVAVCGLDGERAERAAVEALAELHRIEGVMSVWRETSELSKLNRGSGETPSPVSAELYSVIAASLRYSELTAGAFDITARPLVRLWGFQGGEPRRPSDEEIERTRGLVGYGRVRIDEAASTVTLPAGMEIDLGGIAKGYAVDRCAAVLRRHGATAALVDLGGNILAYGAPPGRDSWRIGIRDPRGAHEIVGGLELRDEAVATSGNYENFVEIEGRRYGHIIDPRSGRPVEHVLSVTVVAPTAIEADALSTGLFVLGPEGARSPASRLPAVRALFALPGGEGIEYRRLGDFGRSLRID